MENKRNNVTSHLADHPSNTLQQDTPHTLNLTWYTSHHPRPVWAGQGVRVEGNISVCALWRSPTDWQAKCSTSPSDFYSEIQMRRILTAERRGEEREEREEISGHLNELGWTWEFGRNASGHCEAFMVTSQQPLFCTETERFVLSQWRTMILQQEPFTFWLILLTDSSLTLCQVQSS